MSETLDILEKIRLGEDSYVQFKENLFEAKSLAEEIVAFSNAEGGEIVIGISDSGDLTGLSEKDVSRLNQLISNVANQNVKPPVYPLVELLRIHDKILLIVKIKKGWNKPYCTSAGIYLTKSGNELSKNTKISMIL